jgi:hypothetical protein
VITEPAGAGGESLEPGKPGAELALNDEGLRGIGQLELDLLQARRDAADLRVRLETQPRSFLERSRWRSERELVSRQLVGLDGYADTLERRLRRERIHELERLARRILAGPGGRGAERYLEHSTHDIVEIAATFVAAKALLPFLDAYAKALGKKLGESTGNLLSRLSLDSVMRLTKGQPVVIGADQPVAVELDPNLPDEARLALLDLDLTDAQIHGSVLRWDSAAGRWQPIALPALDPKPLRRIALVAAALGVLPAPRAFAEGLGAGLGEKTADGLLRIRPKPGHRDAHQAADGHGDETAQPVTIEVHPDATDQELAALRKLDLGAPHLRGRTLRWDELSDEWRPFEQGEKPEGWDDL